MIIFRFVRLYINTTLGTLSLNNLRINYINRSSPILPFYFFTNYFHQSCFRCSPYMSSSWCLFYSFKFFHSFCTSILPQNVSFCLVCELFTDTLFHFTPDCTLPALKHLLLNLNSCNSSEKPYKKWHTKIGRFRQLPQYLQPIVTISKQRDLDSASSPKREQQTIIPDCNHLSDEACIVRHGRHGISQFRQGCCRLHSRLPRKYS